MARREARTEDDNPNAERVVLLADEVWRRRFGADTAVVGRRIRLDRASHTIVGIMPREFRFALDWSLSGLTLPAVDLWVPLALTPEEQDAGFDLMVVGRLRHDVSVAMARTRLEAIAEALERRDPKRKGIGLAVVPLQDVIRTAQSALISSRPRALSGIPVRRSKSATDANGARSRSSRSFAAVAAPTPTASHSASVAAFRSNSRANFEPSIFISKRTFGALTGSTGPRPRRSTDGSPSAPSTTASRAASSSAKSGLAASKSRLTALR
ncbi:MAG: ABC transporter permease [Planctomycetes bacterium]|nr:ABC transporter permease [Planctomycetota bacterium]